MHATGPESREMDRRSAAITAFLTRYQQDPRYGAYAHLWAAYPQRTLTGTDFSANNAQYLGAIDTAFRHGHEDMLEMLQYYGTGRRTSG